MQETALHLGKFLKKKRESLSPETFGYSNLRRRTPGLRREEVAQRANISPTWYTWLEQGRSGLPSKEVLDRIAKALLLSSDETEYLFLTTLGHSPQTNYASRDNISHDLQYVLDSLSPNPALIRNLTWDILGWNIPACKIFTDYSKLSIQKRNILKLFFVRKESKRHNKDWQSTARLLVSAFRADVARLGEKEHVLALVSELSTQSEDFKKLWASQEVIDFGSGIKILNKPKIGRLSLSYNSFSVSNNPELSMFVYTPADKESTTKLRNIDPSSSRS